MPMQYNSKNNLYEYGDDYIDAYVEEYIEKTKSHWNSTQLKIIIEQIVSFIDFAMQVLQSNPSDAVQLFQYLHKLNNATTNEEMALIRREEYEHTLVIKNKYKAAGGIRLCLNKQFISQLVSGEFDLGLNLSRYQEKKYIYTNEQKREVKTIINYHLNEAINCLNNLLRANGERKPEPEKDNPPSCTFLNPR